MPDSTDSTSFNPVSILDVFTKPWYKSKTIVAILALLAVQGLSHLLKSDASDLKPQIVDGITGLFTFVAALVAIYGRVKAVAMIGSPGKAVAGTITPASSSASLPPPLDTSKGQRGSIASGMLFCLTIVAVGVLLAGCLSGCSISVGYTPSPAGVTTPGMVSGSVGITPDDITAAANAIASAIAKARATKESAKGLTLLPPPVVTNVVVVVTNKAEPDPKAVDPKQIAP